MNDNYNFNLEYNYITSPWMTSYHRLPGINELPLQNCNPGHLDAHRLALGSNDLPAPSPCIMEDPKFYPLNPLQAS